MIRRVLPLFRRHILIFIILVALVIISSVTKGKTARITSILAGIVMIYAAISFILSIVKTPAKKSKEEVA